MSPAPGWPPLHELQVPSFVVKTWKCRLLMLPSQPLSALRLMENSHESSVALKYAPRNAPGTVVLASE